MCLFLVIVSIALVSGADEKKASTRAGAKKTAESKAEVAAESFFAGFGRGGVSMGWQCCSSRRLKANRGLEGA